MLTFFNNSYPGHKIGKLKNTYELDLLTASLSRNPANSPILSEIKVKTYTCAVNNFK